MIEPVAEWLDPYILFTMATRHSSVLFVATALLFITACPWMNDDDSGFTESSGPPPDPSKSYVCEMIGFTASVVAGHQCVSNENSSTSVVLLEIRDFEGGTAVCTGTIVSDRHVLTAGHCFDDVIDETVSVLSFSAGSFRSSNAETVYRHPSYDPDPWLELIPFDVAVIETLPGALDGAPSSPLLVSRSPELGEAVYLAGFGLTSFNGYTSDQVVAGDASVRRVTDDHIRIDFVHGESHPCMGDSGGPLFLDSTELAIVGLVSQSAPEVAFEDLCDYGDQTLYVNLRNESILSFIREVVVDENGTSLLQEL